MRKVATTMALAFAASAGAQTVPVYDRNSGIPMSSALITTCRLGTTVLSEGATPKAIAGVTIVNAAQARCLIDQFGTQLLTVAAMDDMAQLPGAHPVSFLGSPSDTPAFQAALARLFTPLTAGNLSRPILIYCHHSSCQLSANGAEHLVRAGYKNVFWLRDGLKGWRDAGYALSPKPRLPVGQTESVARFRQAKEFTFACFGEEKEQACETMSRLYFTAYKAADAKPADKPVILSELLNSIAVWGELLRSGGKSGKGMKDLPRAVGVLEQGMGLMREAAAANPAVVGDNLKLQQAVILTYLDTGRPAEAQALLKSVRTLADSRFQALPAERADPKKLQATAKLLIASEELEVALAQDLAKRAKAQFAAGRSDRGQPLLGDALQAYGRALLVTERVGSTGFVGFAKSETPIRLAMLNIEMAELSMAGGNRAVAEKHLAAARQKVCNAGNPSDRNFHQYQLTCRAIDRVKPGAADPRPTA